jgi:hypothetical protein
MKLTTVTPEDRKAEKIGAAVDYRLEIDSHMGGGIGKTSAWFHLGDAQVLALSDALDSATTVVRDTVLGLLWSELDAVVDRLYEDPRTVEGLADALSDGMLIADSPEEAAKWLSWGEDRGQAQGLAYAIAVLTNPRRPDVEAIRAEVARRRDAE